MYVRRTLPLLLAACALASAGCGDAGKGGPGDAKGMESAEGAAAGGALREGEGGPGTPVNDTTPFRPGEPQRP